MKLANFKQKRCIWPIFRILLLLAIFTFTQTILAQVTIGSGEPPQNYSILEVVSSSAEPGGLRLPHVSETDKLRIDTEITLSPGKSKGLLIFNTDKGELEYWDGTEWATLSPIEPWMVSGTTNKASLNDQNIYQKGQVSIGSNITDPTAALNVEATDKGVLLPRVALTSPTDNVTIPTPTTGLLVYNTGASASFTTVGYMFWDGSQWRLFADTSSEPASAVLNCAGAQMSPSQQIVNGTAIIAGTVLQVPYTGSNGGVFNGATLVSSGNPGVTATIANGMLSVGNGMLNFSLSGLPTLAQQAPAGITFDLTPFLNANTGVTGCSQVTVGNILTASIEEVAVMGNFMLVTDNTGNDTGTQYYALQCNSPDGKFSVRAEVPVSQTSVRSGNQYLNIQVRNNQSSDIPVIWNFSTHYGASGGSWDGSGVLTIPPQRWGGDQDSGNNWTNATGSNSSNGAYWGQVGIYDSANNGPEYRRYTWIPLGANNKVSYEITVMVALDTTTPTTAVHPTLIKCYIKFNQVTAQ